MNASAVSSNTLWALLGKIPLLLLTFILLATCACIAVTIENGRRTYGGFPRIGKGLLEPWLRWETPTRWCLDKYEAEGYKKVFHVSACCRCLLVAD